MTGSARNGYPPTLERGIRRCGLKSRESGTCPSSSAAYQPISGLELQGMADEPKSAGLSHDAARMLFERSDNFVCMLDLEGRFTSVNPAGEALTGYRAEELIGCFAADVIAPEHREDAIRDFVHRVKGTGSDRVIDSVLLRRDGTQVPISISSTLIETEGEIAGVLGIVHDLSERRRATRAERALLESERRFRGSFESAAIGMALVSTDGRFLDVNQALCDLLGYDAATLVSLTFQEITHPDDLELDLDYTARVLSGELRSYHMEKRYLHANGKEVWALLSVSLVRSADGTPVHFVSQIQDIDERKRAVAELERREAQLEEAQQLAKVGSWEYRSSTGELTMSDELLRLYGLGPGTRVTLDRLAQFLHPDDRDLITTATDQPLAEGEVRELDFRITLPGQAGRWLRSRAEGIFENGVLVGRRGTTQDVTERKEAEQRFLAAERRYRRLVEQLPLTMYVRPLEMDKPNIYVSPQVEPMLGYPAQSWLTDAGLLARIVHPDDRERVFAEGQRVRQGGAPVEDEYRYVRPDGSVVWVQDVTHLVRDDDGAPLYVQGFLRDITSAKQTEAERDRLRDELLHAQKLEALGRFAGGVAHDFNNMLTAIKGYGELLLDKLEPGSAPYGDATRILRAAEQASDLPRQLLAFGRKQILDPSVVDLNEVVASIGGLLAHVISNSITLEIEARARQAWAVADRSQLEHALVNLALNASDAMPGGGRLTLTTDNVEIDAGDAEGGAHAGSWVVIRVADTGVGMDEETRSKAFEPFFTTKSSADGSGLGLSSVYGTVTQSGGFVELDTAVGRGTTFSLHLPAVAVEAPAGTQPTILLAEDEAIVRDLAEEILATAGYRVLSAADGAQALALFEEHRAEISGVVTDIVMPKVGGRELARRIREYDADLPIVFISGHHQETSETLQLGPAAALLQKPFSLSTLVDTVDGLIGSGSVVQAPVVATLTCLVADDHPAVLDSVSRFLTSRGIGTDVAHDGEEALARIEATRPHVAVLDVRMAPVGGIDIAARVRELSPETQVVLYTGHNDQALLDRALEAGARGFVLKEAPLQSLADAIRIVAGGGTYVDSQLARSVASASTVSTLPPLTPREREVLGLVADGLTNEKVAAALAISPETVQSHVRHAMVKLAADTRTEAVATALRHALIS